jgi:hypothetical protein
MPGPRRWFLRPFYAKHILNFSNTATTGRGASAPFWLEKAPAFGYPSATDFEIVVLSIA